MFFFSPYWLDAENYKSRTWGSLLNYQFLPYSQNKCNFLLFTFKLAIRSSAVIGVLQFQSNTLDE